VAGWRIYLEFERWRIKCTHCSSVRIEHLDWLAKNPRYTRRFALHVGNLCRDMTVSRVAEIERLHHSTVKDLDKLYMRQQVALAGTPSPRAVGIDEISIRKGHNYRVIVSDLDRRRPIWVGGEGRKEEDLDEFFNFIGKTKSKHVKLAAMDMWKAFRNSTLKNAPDALIIYDKFHIMSHLSKALDQVRRAEYKRLSGKDRSYIKGQRYTLLSNKENLDLKGRRALKKLLAANSRLNTAYLLKEVFGQLWDYKTARGARAFFERWKDSLKWKRLKPYVKFAAMVERHWDGIVSYCNPDNKVSLGLVEGVNNKIRVIQRKAYGYRDEEYLKLKIIASFLPPLPKSATINPLNSA
jgi:transposase